MIGRQRRLRLLAGLRQDAVLVDRQAMVEFEPARVLRRQPAGQLSCQAFLRVHRSAALVQRGRQLAVLAVLLAEERQVYRDGQADEVGPGVAVRQHPLPIAVAEIDGPARPGLFTRQVDVRRLRSDLGVRRP